jgi:hypothetical protein
MQNTTPGIAMTEEGATDEDSMKNLVTVKIRHLI